MNIDSFIKKFSFINNFNNYPDGIIVIDYLNNITFWNKKATKIFGYSASEMIGRNIALIFDTDAEKIYKAIETGKTYVLSSKNNLDEDLFIDISCEDLKAKKKIIITVRDVTKNQKVLERLLLEHDSSTKINNNKNNFITGLSNEFKNPIHSLIGFSQGLLDGICGELNEKQHKYVTIMNKNANNLLDFIDSFLELSRLEMSNIDFEQKVFDLSSAMRQERTKYQHKAEEKGLAFEIDLKDLVKKNIYSSEEALLKILSILLDNAIKFTETGNVRLKIMHPCLDLVNKAGIPSTESNEDKSYLLFNITDTGMGIAEEDIPVIFDEYLQQDRNTARKYGGTGLKLALCKKMISHLGGTIWAESEPGQGSTFSFILPIEKPSTIQQTEALQEIASE